MDNENKVFVAMVMLFTGMLIAAYYYVDYVNSSKLPAAPVEQMIKSTSERTCRDLCAPQDYVHRYNGTCYCWERSEKS